MNAKILVGVTDHLDPEEQAMLLAMYSRTFASIESRLPTTQEETNSLKQRLGKFYVGYGHKSVGQLGTTTIFLEGVSQIAAKAIEDTPLFNGQESSTRYIDYSTQPLVSYNEEIAQWQARFMDLYQRALPETIAKVSAEYPLEAQGDNVARITYVNTVNARAFDICRGILPAGSTTNVGFSGTFDTLNDQFGKLLYHPASEVQELASAVLEELGKKYPSASYPKEKHLQRNEHKKEPSNFYYTPDSPPEYAGALEFDSILKNRQLLESFPARNKFEEYPRQVASKLVMTYTALLDFGGYRDIHRHRRGYCSMPVVAPEKGIHTFYLTQLPDSIAAEFQELFNNYKKWFNDTQLSIYEKQYATPMGAVVCFEYTCDINQALYIAELRSGKTVHQTVRQYAQDLTMWLQGWTNQRIAIHADKSYDNFTLKRGEQTFSQEAMS